MDFFCHNSSFFAAKVASLDLVPWVLLTGSGSCFVVLRQFFFFSLFQGGAFIGALIILFLSAKCSVRIWSLLHSVLVASGLVKSVIL
jgi:hypothetical protein